MGERNLGLPVCWVANPRHPGRVGAGFITGLFALMMTLVLAGCRHQTPDGTLVLTQIPLETKSTEKTPDILDALYPPGSRVVCVAPPYRPGEVRVLSSGLIAAGSPLVSTDGKRVYFAGKARLGGAWQIYETPGGGGRPRAVTALEGGAMDPAILGKGDLIFSSPVPKLGETWRTPKPSALYRQSPGGTPQRLTYGVTGAVEPTVLRDGTILFVSALVTASTNEPTQLGLFTINDDGTEVTAFALDHDGAPWVRRPRELFDGRVGFLAMAAESGAGGIWAEGVRAARPFASRSRLFSFSSGSCRSVEPDSQGALLVCLETRGLSGRSMSGSYAVYRVGSEMKELGAPLFHDPAWHNLEAVPLAARPKPMGHVTAIKPALKFGTILCLNANFTRPSLANASNGLAVAKVGRVRVLARNGSNSEQVLGEVALQADGSFMATVPAETPIGFEALDDQDRVVRRVPPSVWLRRGENRSCLGCHEPYNRSPRNVRPIAAGLPPVNLAEKNPTLTPSTP